MLYENSQNLNQLSILRSVNHLIQYICIIHLCSLIWMEIFSLIDSSPGGIGYKVLMNAMPSMGGFIPYIQNRNVHVTLHLQTI